MFRFALAYQGSGGTQVILSGTAIDLISGSNVIDIGESQRIDVGSGATALDISATGKAIDVQHDRNSIDL